MGILQSEKTIVIIDDQEKHAHGLAEALVGVKGVSFKWARVSAKGSPAARQPDGWATQTFYCEKAFDDASDAKVAQEIVDYIKTFDGVSVALALDIPYTSDKIDILERKDDTLMLSMHVYKKLRDASIPCVLYVALKREEFWDELWGRRNRRVYRLYESLDPSIYDWNLITHSFWHSPDELKCFENDLGVERLEE
jgi:hypothetical protein